MSKEMEAFERIKEHCSVSVDYFYENFANDLDIIETALKRLVYLEERVDDLKKDKNDLHEHNQMLLKYFKALKIIENKRVDINFLLEVVLYPKNGLKAYNQEFCESRQLTQEDYELLKEALLCNQ